LRGVHSPSFLAGVATSAAIVLMTLVVSVSLAAGGGIADWQPGALLAIGIVAAGLTVLPPLVGIAVSLFSKNG
jgi:hypothetical protein